MPDSKKQKPRHRTVWARFPHLGKWVETPIVREKKLISGKREYLTIRNPDVLHRAHERALAASVRMQVRLGKLLAGGRISEKEYLGIRRQIEEKGNRLVRLTETQGKRLSERDPLLGMLYNRSTFQNMAWSFLRKKKGTLLILDIDHFGRINDTLGHPAGDAALRFFGLRVNETARKLNGLAGRTGGEEFGIVLPGTVNEAKRFIRLLNTSLVKGFSSDKLIASQLRGMSFTFSAGVASATEAKSWEELMKKADERLYFSKENGRNSMTLPPARRGKNASQRIISIRRKTR